MPSEALGTCAVNVTFCPRLAGLGEMVSVVVVELIGAMIEVESATEATSVPLTETEAELTTCAGAFEATLNVRIMEGKLAPGARESDLVQVNDDRSQLQPVPAIPVVVSPSGIVSVTLITPAVAVDCSHYARE